MHIPVIPYIVAMQNNPNGNDEEQYKNFMDTVESMKVLYKNIFINTLTNARDEEKVLQSYDGSEILRLNEKLPWFEAVLNNWNYFEKCKIAIYPDHKKKGYRIQSLPGSQSSRFKNRCGAPVAWRGRELYGYGRERVPLHGGGHPPPHSFIKQVLPAEPSLKKTLKSWPENGWIMQRCNR